jgi:hypothetical protein
MEVVQTEEQKTVLAEASGSGQKTAELRTKLGSMCVERSQWKPTEECVCQQKTVEADSKAVCVERRLC